MQVAAHEGSFYCMKYLDLSPPHQMKGWLGKQPGDGGDGNAHISYERANIK